MLNVKCAESAIEHSKSNLGIAKPRSEGKPTENIELCNTPLQYKTMPAAHSLQ